MNELERVVRDLVIDVVRDVVRDEVRRALADAPRADGELMSTTEAAAFARLTTSTIRRWIRNGRLVRHGAGRMVRVRRVELEALLAGHTNDDALTPEQLADRDFR